MWAGGTRSRCFNSGYRDPELLEVLPISTVRIQLHVSALYVDHLQVVIFNLQISYTRCMGRLGGRGGGIPCSWDSNEKTRITTV